MKSKLLKRLREEGRNQISIHGTVKQKGIVVGMTIGMDSDSYSNIFEFGDTEEIVLKKAENIYLSENIEKIKLKYKRYSKLGL